MRSAISALFVLTGCAATLPPGATRSEARQRAAGVLWIWHAGSPGVIANELAGPVVAPEHDLRAWIESTPAPQNAHRAPNQPLRVRVERAQYRYGRQLRCGNDVQGELAYSVVLALEGLHPNETTFRFERQSGRCAAASSSAALRRCLDDATRSILDEFFQAWSSTR